MRKVLDAEHIADAIQAILKADRASACNFLMAHADGEIVDIEAAPYDANIIFSDDGVLTHSNHFTIPNCKIKELGLPLWPSSLFRKHRSEKLLKRELGKITPDTFKMILSDHFDKPHSLCKHPDKRLPESEWGQTIASLVMDVNEKTLHISMGPPCENEYTIHNFHKL
jgi:isopenicillin-N N-acyltransferase-like protein